jgi:hypothetical protein
LQNFFKSVIRGPWINALARCFMIFFRLSVI